MGLKVGSLDHYDPFLTMTRRQPDHHLGEDPLITPPLPTVVDCLVRSIVPRGIAPPQAIAIDEDYPNQNRPVINRRLAMGFGGIGLKTRHPRITQPEEIRPVTARFSSDESPQQTEINGA
jgi:hypothetical protein